MTTLKRPGCRNAGASPGAIPPGGPDSLISQTSVLILAGGLGTRLRSVVADVPKVLAPVQGRPFLAWLLDQVAGAGARHVVLCTGYRGDLVRSAFGARYRSLDIDYSQEPEPLGTGGALRYALRRARSETVLAMNGDSWCEIDLGALCEAGGTPNASQTGSQDATGACRGDVSPVIALVRTLDTGRYGQVEFDERGRVTRFVEKGASGGPGWINAGIYLLPGHCLREGSPAAPTPDGMTTAISLERDWLPRWVASGLIAFPASGRFLDIGTPESFAQSAGLFSGAA